VVILALLNIGGVSMPTPTELTVSVQDLSKADRNANGTMVIERIATKLKLACKWSYISDYDLSKVLTAISPTTYYITFVDPVTNSWTTRNMYCGDRSAGYISFQNNTAMYKDFSVDFIEI
jgi:hypothetical protein